MPGWEDGESAVWIGIFLAVPRRSQSVAPNRSSFVLGNCPIRAILLSSRIGLPGNLWTFRFSARITALARNRMVLYVNLGIGRSKIVHPMWIFAVPLSLIDDLCQ
jgi:hypothetical protein